MANIFGVQASPRVMQRFVLLVASLVGAGLLYLLFMPRPVSAEKTANVAPVPVILARVRHEAVNDYVSGIGTISAADSATLRTRLDGELIKLDFIEGQDVKAGDVLAEIDPKALQAQLNIAQAQLARDEALLHNAEADLQRYSNLVDQGLVSRQALETQRALVTQHQATVHADQAQVDYAQVQLGYTRIRAPFDGRTGVRLIGQGNLLRAADAIVTLNRVDQVSLLFTVPESEFTRIQHAASTYKNNLKVLALDNDSQLLSEGKLLLVDNQIDTSSGTVQIKAVFDNRHRQLWPGQFVNARLVLGESKDTLVLPASAVQRGPDGNFVYVVVNNKAMVRAIQVARLQDDKAIIASGLEADEVVVAEGQTKLRPGLTVAGVTSDTHAEHVALAQAAPLRTQ